MSADAAPSWPVAAITGHRHLGAPQTGWMASELTRVLRRLHDEHHTRALTCGMALGADTRAAMTALDLGWALHAYLPSPAGQSDRWNPGQRHRYRRLLALASSVHHAQPTYSTAALHARNAQLVDAADIVVAVHDGRTGGGTSMAVAHARATGKPIIRLDPATRTTTLKVPAGHPARDQG